MSTVTIVVLLGVAFSVGAVVGMLVVAACAAGSREDAWRSGYLDGLSTERPEVDEELLQAQCKDCGNDDDEEVTR